MDEGLVPQAFNWIAVAIYSLILHTEAGAGIRGSISTILILERKLVTFNQNWQNMNTFWDLVEAVNRPPYGSHSVRELVQLLHYYYIILQVACPYRKFFQ